MGKKAVVGVCKALLGKLKGKLDGKAVDKAKASSGQSVTINIDTVHISGIALATVVVVLGTVAILTGGFIFYVLFI